MSNLRVDGWIITAKHRTQGLWQHRRCDCFWLVNLDLLLNGMNEPFAHIASGDGLLGDLTQRDDRGLVVVLLNGDRSTFAERARPMCRQEYEVEPIGNLVDAVFDCYARHAVLPVLCKACCNDTLPLRFPLAP